MTTEHAPDMIVAGTGLVGLTAALALAQAGFRVTLVGPQPSTTDRRTTAVMAPGLQLLERLGLRSALESAGAPLRAMRIVDATRRLIRSPTVTFSAAEIGEDAFGWNIPNGHLIGTLHHAIQAEMRIARHVGVVERWELDEGGARAFLDDGSRLAAPLVVAADGRGSSAREAAGIGMRQRVLPQTALALSFTHKREHNFVSTEFHTEAGPFTQVPLPGLRSSLVWVETPARAAALLDLDDARLSEAVEERMQSMLGKISVEPGRGSFPLAEVSPSRFGANRVALVGEAAHTIPPIGAQGFNLALADIAALLELAEERRGGDIGSPEAMTAYHRARAADIARRTTAVGLLNASLLSDLLPMQVARSAALAGLSGIRPLRTLLMREGMRPGSGFSTLFSSRGEAQPGR